MPERPTLLCGAMPFGYGPAAKLLTLADRLAADWRLVFVGGGSAHELIARSTSRFDAVHASEGAVPDRLLAEADAALSLMDRRLAEAAVRASLPLAVVDSLLWMRSETPAALKHARLYLAQAFPALGPEAHDPRPVVVGPIVATTPVRGRDAARAGLVLNLGGSAAPDGRHALYVAYARMLLEALHGSGLRERFGRISVLGGRATLDAIASHPAADGLELRSASAGEARERIAGAAMVLTAPGLTTTLQCFRDAVPTGFLPPQNYSQWCILRHLRSAGVASSSFHWEDLRGAPSLPERMPPADSTPRVVDAITRFATDPRAIAALRTSLTRMAEEAPGRVEAQSAFFHALGGDGAEAVADALRIWIPVSQRGVAHGEGRIRFMRTL